MKIHELSSGFKKEKRRLGRGIGSGLGKTSGKGHKGQNSRSGGGVRPGFEGGQMPLTRRLPKFGFTNNFRKEYTAVNIGRLAGFESGATVTGEILLEAGLISKLAPYGLKILGCGKLRAPIKVVAAKFSESAKAAIEKAGGTAEIAAVNVAAAE
jgi:large subunit ribosomal protein L15